MRDLLACLSGVLEPGCVGQVCLSRVGVLGDSVHDCGHLIGGHPLGRPADLAARAGTRAARRPRAASQVACVSTYLRA